MSQFKNSCLILRFYYFNELTKNGPYVPLKIHTLIACHSELLALQDEHHRAMQNISKICLEHLLLLPHLSVSPLHLECPFVRQYKLHVNNQLSRLPDEIDNLNGFPVL